MATDTNENDVARSEGGDDQNVTGNLWWPVAQVVIRNIEADRDLAKGLDDNLRFRYLMVKLFLGLVMILGLAALWVVRGYVASEGSGR